jgi:hypothetical protein
LVFTTLYQTVVEIVEVYPVPDPPVEVPPGLVLPDEFTGPTTTAFELSFACHVAYSAASICRVMGFAAIEGFVA